jgi:hypothetical protein
MIFLEDIKIIKHLCTYLVVSPFKVSIKDIILSPWPLIFQLVGMLYLQQEFLHFFLKLPERGATVDHVLAFHIQIHVQTAK